MFASLGQEFGYLLDAPCTFKRNSELSRKIYSSKIVGLQWHRHIVIAEMKSTEIRFDNIIKVETLKQKGRRNHRLGRDSELCARRCFSRIQLSELCPMLCPSLLFPCLRFSYVAQYSPVHLPPLGLFHSTWTCLIEIMGRLCTRKSTMSAISRCLNCSDGAPPSTSRSCPQGQAHFSTRFIHWHYQICWVYTWNVYYICFLIATMNVLCSERRDAGQHIRDLYSQSRKRAGCGLLCLRSLLRDWLFMVLINECSNLIGCDKEILTTRRTLHFWSCHVPFYTKVSAASQSTARQLLPLLLPQSKKEKKSRYSSGAMFEKCFDKP